MKPVLWLIKERTLTWIYIEPTEKLSEVINQTSSTITLYFTSCLGFTMERILLMDSPSDRPSKSMKEREHLKREGMEEWNRMS